MQVQQIMFHPSPGQMHFYTKLIESRVTAPSDKVAAHALTCVFLVHQHNWQLLRPFIEAGGMVNLVSTLASENLHMRGQV